MKYDYDIPKEIKPARHSADHSGAVSGKVLIHYPVGHSGPPEMPKKYLMWLCECECGVMFTARAQTIKEGRISSCGRCEKVNASLLRHLPEIPRKIPEQLTLPGIPTQDALADITSFVEELEAKAIPVPAATMREKDLFEEMVEPEDMDDLAVLGICTDALETQDSDTCERILKFLQSKHVDEIPF